MVTALDVGKQAIKEAAERLEKASTAEHAPALQTRFPQLLKRIKDGTLTPGDIDDFLRKEENLPPDLKQYLLGRKAWLLLRGRETEDALRAYDEALAAAPESLATWLMKGSALLELNRLDEAFQAFQKAYALRDNFGPQRQEYLKDLFRGWGHSAYLLGLEGSLQQDLRKYEKGVSGFLDVTEQAQSEGLEDMVLLKPVVARPATQELQAALEEVDLGIKLLAIKDPFEGLRALSKELSKHWPKGMSAVDAIREQRDRQWNS